MKPGCNVAALIERYFTDRLMRQHDRFLPRYVPVAVHVCAREASQDAVGPDA